MAFRAVGYFNTSDGSGITRNLDFRACTWKLKPETKKWILNKIFVHFSTNLFSHLFNDFSKFRNVLSDQLRFTLKNHQIL